MSDSEAKRVPRIAEKTNSINERHVYPAYRLTFRLAKVLPADEPLSIPLLRLMMASNDVRHIQKLMLSKNEQIGQGNQVEEAVLNGEVFSILNACCAAIYTKLGRPFGISTSLIQKSPMLLLLEPKMKHHYSVYQRPSLLTRQGHFMIPS